MKPRLRKQEDGFTLIELLIVVLILGSLVPTFYRFFNEGVKKGIVSPNESVLLRDTRILFRYMEQDLHHARAVLPSFEGLSSGGSSLIVKTVSIKDRLHLMSKPADLTGEALKAGEYVVHYRLNNSKEIVRTVYEYGRHKSSLALLGRVTELGFEYDKGKPDEASWVRVAIAGPPKRRTSNHLGELSRLFRVG